MKRAIAALFVAPAIAWVGCTVWNDAVLPIHDVHDAGLEEEAAALDAGCARFPVPSAAPSPDAGTGGDIDVVVAIQAISLGLTNGKIAPTFGYDLDGVCTCKPDPESCTTRADAGHCDGDLGRDDETGALLASLGIPDPSLNANQSIQQGLRGIIARIQGYNGLPNDDQVTFSLYRSPGTDTPPDFTNPDQAWKIDQTDIVLGGGMYDAKTTSTGFVKDGQLVIFELASSQIPFNTDSDLLLQQVSFTGDMFKDPTSGHWRINNVVGVGRWPVADAITTIAHVQDPTNSHQRLCQNATLMALAIPQICAAADLFDNPSQDNKGQVCNAISTAVMLTTAPAALGAVVTPDREDPCAGITIGTCN